MNYIKSIITLCCLGILSSACTQSKSSHENESARVDSNKISPQPVVLKDKNVNLVYSNYIDLKNALVSSKIDKAQSAASNLANSLLKVKGWEHTTGLAKQVAASNDLIVQRAYFTDISSDIIALIRNTEVSAGTLYMQYCPMANSGKGGSWLSSENQIRNPYYGDKMLNCGSVKEEFKKK